MKPKEIILYDSYFSLEKDRDIREYLFDTYARKKGWKTKEDIPDRRVIEEWENQDGILWNELKDNLESYFENSYYLLTGYFGSWHGNREGGNFIRSFKDLLTVIQHLNDIRMIDRNGHFIIEGSHHDGSDRYEIKRLTRKGYELANSYYFAKDRKLHYTLMHNNFYTALPHFAQQIYGGRQNMRYIYYYYLHGALILKYRDENGYRTTRRYLFYTLREALQKFRKDNGLRYKHITVKKYFDKSGGNK